MTGSVSCELRDRFANISLDDGKVNVMSTAMLREIAGAFDRVEGNAEIVVLRFGRPGIFSAVLT
jgi:enoyl-CoA hydratase